MKKVIIAVSALSLLGVSAAFAKEPAEIMKTVCAPCHGANGEGKKPMGPSLKDSQFVKTASEADIAATIKKGRAGADKKFKEFPSPMPPQAALSDAELSALVKHLKSLK